MNRTALAVVSLLAIGCHGQHDNANAFNWSRDLAGGGTLRIRNTNGSITAVPSTNGTTARVRAATHWRRGNPERDLKFVAVSEGSDATICVHWGDGTCSATAYTNSRKRGFASWFFKRRRTDARVDFTVEAPSRGSAGRGHARRRREVREWRGDAGRARRAGQDRKPGGSLTKPGGSVTAHHEVTKQHEGPRSTDLGGRRDKRSSRFPPRCSSSCTLRVLRAFVVCSKIKPGKHFAASANFPPSQAL